MWQDHAEFSTRIGNLELALSSIRSALEIDPGHAASLLLLSMVSLTMFLRGQEATAAAEGETEVAEGEARPAVDGEAGLKHLEAARVAAHSLVHANDADAIMPWALLALVHSKGEILT